MRRVVLLSAFLIVLALIPIVVWGYTAYGTVISFQMAAQGARKTGQAAAILILVLAGLTPSFVGGILMAVGAFLLDRKPLGARITATIGLVLVVMTVAVFIAFEASMAGDELLIAAAFYLLLHATVIVWLWRGWRRPAV